jgi:Tfp pilus assembly pilus retraction ATPase PilT
MALLSWDRLFGTCISLDASDIVLLAGMPPFLRQADGLRAVAVPSLTDVEIGSMLRALSPLPERPNDDGYFSFLVSYQKRWWFRVASFGVPAPHFTILMRLREPPQGDPMAEAAR